MDPPIGIVIAIFIVIFLLSLIPDPKPEYIEVVNTKYPDRSFKVPQGHVTNAIRNQQKLEYSPDTIYQGYTVYWLVDASHPDAHPERDGYIGLSCCLHKRITDHLERIHEGRHSNSTFNLLKNKTLRIATLARNLTKEQAQELEWEYRKQWFTGYNIEPGGRA